MLLHLRDAVADRSGDAGEGGARGRGTGARRGAEKNFEAFAVRLEDDAEPPVDRPFFEQVVARAIIWRAAEKAFDSFDLNGYRANSVAYGMAWLAERSARRIDLQKIWHGQTVPDGITSALRAICKEAHAILTARAGNVGEASKRPETWAEFRDLDFNVGEGWKKDATAAPAAAYPAKKPNAEVEAARSTVKAVSANNWFALAKWSKEHGFLEGWERSLSFSLGKLASRGTDPTTSRLYRVLESWRARVSSDFNLTSSCGDRRISKAKLGGHVTHSWKRYRDDGRLPRPEHDQLDEGQIEDQGRSMCSFYGASKPLKLAEGAVALGLPGKSAAMARRYAT